MSKKQSKTIIVESEKLNKFEKTRLLTARALEISKGAKPKLSEEELGFTPLTTQDYLKIAEREFESGLLELEVLKKE
ncbi:DNA-directed RNA polymerase subunit omega [Candidatus Woesearchaeota archaeon]|nr:DNA-directed RNA polymerase subunit omega [Nanoarchaeota archaeon]MCB9370218.1 DNA-directed RNA polymerase subunit omega [Candidatus Woesearchaeota archaeon]USN44743.1 MAG: DNA-directed RNA polymerase subunit omega [Candidatus Woesearchaeota archaeon]